MSIVRICSPKYPQQHKDCPYCRDSCCTLTYERYADCCLFDDLEMIRDQNMTIDNYKKLTLYSYLPLDCSLFAEDPNEFDKLINNKDKQLNCPKPMDFICQYIKNKEDIIKIENVFTMDNDRLVHMGKELLQATYIIPIKCLLLQYSIGCDYRDRNENVYINIPRQY